MHDQLLLTRFERGIIFFAISNVVRIAFLFFIFFKHTGNEGDQQQHRNVHEI